MRRMCAEDNESTVIEAFSDAGSQRTAPASSFSLCVPEMPVATSTDVKATINEGADDGLNGQPDELAQITRWISRPGAVNSTEVWLCNGLGGAFPRNDLRPPSGICFNSTRKKSELSFPRFSTLCRSTLPGLTRKAPFSVGGLVRPKECSSRCSKRTGPESLKYTYTVGNLE
jgi:hypothetical protein